MRWLEYGLRLQTRRRNLLTSAAARSSGRNLLDGVLRGGARACGRNIGLIAPGKRADFVVLEHNHARLYGRSGDDVLDSWIFSGNDNLVRDVYIGGFKVIENGHHGMETEIGQRYRETLDQLAS